MFVVVLWQVLHVISNYIPCLPSQVVKIVLQPNWTGHFLRAIDINFPISKLDTFPKSKTP
jgi:hypothetical protein